MFNQNEITMLTDALDMALKSNKRAMNTRTNPQFQEIHRKIETDLNELMLKVKTASQPQKPNK